MRQYQQVIEEEREAIAIGLSKGLSKREIGKKIGRHHTTVSREISRNRLYGRRPSLIEQPYSAMRAQKKAEKRKREQRQKAPLKNTLIFVYVREHLREPYRWSPETVAGRLSIDHPGNTITPECIYQYIYEKGKRFKLWKYLVHHRKKRMKHQGRKVKKYARLAGAIPIDERPKHINNRARIGDFESDNMEGKISDKTAVSVTVDRTSRKVRIRKLTDHTADTKARAVIKAIGSDTAYTLTVDRGPENSRHDKIEQKTGIITYACNPYHSWEKGTVENTIGRIRRRVPKGTSVDPLSQRQCTAIEKWMNSTPRKCLGYLTPDEFHETIPITSYFYHWCTSS